MERKQKHEEISTEFRFVCYNRHDTVFPPVTRNLLDGSCSYSEIKKGSEEKESEISIPTELTLSLEQKISGSGNNGKPKEKSILSLLDKESGINDERVRLSLFSEQGRSQESIYVGRAHFSPPSQEWKIKKTLTESDLGQLSRLLVRTGSVNEHILPLLGEEEIKNGKEVRVWDCDTKSEHKLVFKRWISCKGYVFVGKWIPDFVKRRNLKKDDIVGLYWDCSESRFNFSVLQRASTIVHQ